MSVSKIDQYFDLSPEQQKKLEEDVNSDLENLRRERFVKLAAALRAIDREAQHASRNENVLGNAYTVLQREYKMDSGQLSSSAKKLMVSLKREQILYFQTQVDKEIASDRAESVADKNRELVSRFRKVFKFFAGDLTPEQSNSITTFTQMKPFPWKQKIDNREQILVRFLKFQSQPEQRAKLVGQFMENYDSLCTPEYLREMTNYENEFKDFLNKFWTTMSSEQKVQLHLHLEDQAQELERLARGL
ncbi:MAG: DUF6279 family lipoprotein [Bacillota bacterium]